jgi:hypothetical protein
MCSRATGAGRIGLCASCVLGALTEHIAAGIHGPVWQSSIAQRCRALNFTGDERRWWQQRALGWAAAVCGGVSLVAVVGAGLPGAVLHAVGDTLPPFMTSGMYAPPPLLDPPMPLNGTIAIKPNVLAAITAAAASAGKLPRPLSFIPCTRSCKCLSVSCRALITTMHYVAIRVEPCVTVDVAPGSILMFVASWASWES